MKEKKIWHQVDGHQEIYYGHYIVPNFMSNSIAIQVAEKEWVVISPGEPMLTDWHAKWGVEGIKLSIIFPNHYHHMGVEAWKEVFPGAELYASQKAVNALKEKGFDEVVALEGKQPNLPSGYSILIPPGHRGGDAWVCKQNSEEGNVWVTCDSFQNYSRMSNQPVARFMQKVFATAPGLKMSRFVRWLLIDDKKSFKHWALTKIDEHQPTTMIPSHGSIAQADDLPEQLKALVNGVL